jgi:hypothetical protein
MGAIDSSETVLLIYQTIPYYIQKDRIIIIYLYENMEFKMKRYFEMEVKLHRLFIAVVSY